MNRECTLVDTVSSCWVHAMLLLILLATVPQAARVISPAASRCGLPFYVAEQLEAGYSSQKNRLSRTNSAKPSPRN